MGDPGLPSIKALGHPGTCGSPWVVEGEQQVVEVGRIGSDIIDIGDPDRQLPVEKPSGHDKVLSTIGRYPKAHGITTHSISHVDLLRVFLG